MSELKLGAVESRFADIIWQHEPITSTELAKRSEAELSWKNQQGWSSQCRHGLHSSA